MTTRAGFNSFVNNNLAFLNEPFPKGFLKLFLVLYAGMAAPKLPNRILSLLDHTAFRLLVLFLVLWTGNSDPTLSLLIAVAFTVTMVTLGTRKQEGFFGFRDGDRFLTCSQAKARANVNIDNSLTTSGLEPERENNVACPIVDY